MCTKFDYTLLFEVLDGKGDCYTFPCDCSGNVDPAFLARSNFNDSLFEQCKTRNVDGFPVGAGIIKPGFWLRLDKRY